MALDTLVLAVCAALLVSAAILLVLVGTLATELVAAVVSSLLQRGPPAKQAADLDAPDPEGSYVIVMPAHDEVGTIETTLAAVIPEVSGKGRVLVVADNCTDETAAVAEAAGASVIVRNDPSKRGKSYALDFAVRSLEGDPPDVIIILDADCIPETGTIQKLFETCQISKHPVQARYEMAAPAANASPFARVGLFAWRVKNRLRPMGLKALGVPCLLAGTGMAFPWASLARSNLKSGHLVEDMVLGLELAARGEGPDFLPEACVRSSLPPNIEGQQSQRTRWETGHLQVIRQHVPELLRQAIRQSDYRLLVLALHAAVPPLALLVAMLMVTTVASGLFALVGGPAICFKISGIATGIAGIVFAAYWFWVGRDLLSIRDFLLLPGYAISKLPIYRRALSGERIEWIRTKRH